MSIKFINPLFKGHLQWMVIVAVGVILLVGLNFSENFTTFVDRGFYICRTSFFYISGRVVGELTTFVGIFYICG